MSRVYEAAMEAGLGGEWRWECCEECGGDNQRQKPTGMLTQWWFGDRADYVCVLCRSEMDAAEQKASELLEES